MNRNRMRICGRNTTTAPTPPITPSTISERRNPSGSAAVTPWLSALIPASIQPTGVSLHANTAWNMTNMIVARINGPAKG